MLKIRTTLICVAAVAAAALALPAVAGAADRYASPDGVGADPCTSAAPCPIDIAVEGASSGADEVILVGGVPPAAPFIPPLADPDPAFSGLNVPNDVVVRGATGARPVIEFGPAFPAAGFLMGSGSVLRDLDIEYAADSAAIQFNNGTSPGVIERVLARAIDGDEPQNARAPCLALGDATIRDSVCWYDTVSVQSAAIEVRALIAPDDHTVTIRNSTAISIGAEAAIMAHAQSSGVATANVTNSVARSESGPDVEGFVVNGGVATITLDHSNYATESAPIEPASITDPGSATNQTLAPVFVNAAGGDFRQAAASTGTLNLGTATGLLPAELDLDGNARNQGGAPDIGAFESTPPLVNDPPSTPTPPATKKKKCKKAKKGKKGAGAAKKKKKKKKKCKKKKKK